jgi:hypothetical protein
MRNPGPKELEMATTDAEERTNLEARRNAYGPGHPWFYVLGGNPLYPRQIMEAAECAAYRGCLAPEIDRIDSLKEPRRSTALRSMRDKALADYRVDLSRYREVALILRRYRSDKIGNDEPACSDIHVAISLKHNHLFNDFAHLRVLGQMLDRQRDLFDF